MRYGILLFLMFLPACSMLYMNAVREDPLTVRIVGGEKRSQLRKKFGRPISSTKSSDSFRLRGRLDKNDESRAAAAMTSFTFGLGEIVLLPYILVSETSGALFEHFCFSVGYDSDDKAINYSGSHKC
jgi:hypothetical protein